MILAIDFETTGLRPYSGDTVICTALAFYDVSSYRTEFFTGNDLSFLSEYLENPDCLMIAHNAKFEMNFVRAHYGPFKCKFWCTQVMDRVVNNSYKEYSLDACAKRIGMHKDDKVKKYMDDNKLYVVDKDSKKKDYFFHKVPIELLEPYCRLDATIAFQLYNNQSVSLEFYNRSKNRIQSLVNLELATTKVLHEMEYNGIKCDRDYCLNAISFEENREKESLEKFNRITGTPLVNSAKCLKPIFDAYGMKYGLTEDGNPSFKEDHISCNNNELVRCILNARDAHKRIYSYYKKFLKFMDSNDRIHANIRQSGAATGRMSATDPAIQTFTSDTDDYPYPIRRAFIADEGTSIFSIDYSQMEYRMLADEAGEEALCNRIMSGEDVHEVTASIMGVDRQKAKTIGFGLLYGQGATKLANTLGVSYEQAVLLRNQYLSSLPSIGRYVRNSDQEVKIFGYCLNWINRRSFLKMDESYKAVNYKIQGGCADVFRVALVNISKLKFSSPKTFPMLPIHDEICFQIADEDRVMIPEIVDAMRNAFLSSKYLKMDVKVEFGPNLFDLSPYSI